MITTVILIVLVGLTANYLLMKLVIRWFKRHCEKSGIEFAEKNRTNISAAILSLKGAVSVPIFLLALTALSWSNHAAYPLSGKAWTLLVICGVLFMLIFLGMFTQAYTHLRKR